MKLERKDETKQSVRGVSSLRVFDYPLTAANVAAIHAQRPLPPPTLLPRGGPMLYSEASIPCRECRRRRGVGGGVILGGGSVIGGGAAAASERRRQRRRRGRRQRRRRQRRGWRRWRRRRRRKNDRFAQSHGARREASGGESR